MTTTTITTRPPSLFLSSDPTMRVELFTSLECHAESNQLRDWLTRQDIGFREVDLTARPDYHTQLLQRFGADFTVPGILWNDSEWFGWSNSSSSTNQDDDSNQEMADSHCMDPARHAVGWTRLQQRLHESAVVETNVPQPQDGSRSSSSSTCSTRSSLPSHNKNKSAAVVVGTVDPPRTPSTTPGSSTPQRATTLPDQKDSRLVEGAPHKKTTTKDDDNKDSNDDDDKTSDRRRFPKDTHPLLLVGRDHDSFVWWGTSLATLNSSNTPIPARSDPTATNAAALSHKAHRRNSASELLAMMNDPNEKGRPFSGISLDDESEEEEEEEEQDTGPDMDPTLAQFPTTLSPSSTSTTSKSTQTPHDEEPSQAVHHSTVVQGASPSFSAGKVTVSSSCLWVQRQALLLPLVPLPNGKHVTVAALTRLLLQVLPHEIRIHPGTGDPVYSFRGAEGLHWWRVLFAASPSSGWNDAGAEEPSSHHHHATTTSSITKRTPSVADLEAFGQLLVERGIVHNYTPNVTDFSKFFLVVQPLKEPHVLNSLVQWPVETNSYPTTTTTLAQPKEPRKTIQNNKLARDPMHVLLHLSRLMDDICSTAARDTDNTSAAAQEQELYNSRLFQDYEVACCQLQVLSLPQHKMERVAFLINLFNCIVRHAMILAVAGPTAHSSQHREQEEGPPTAVPPNLWVAHVTNLWPHSMTGLQDEFFHQIGYNVGGMFMSLAYLQKCLYGAPRNTNDMGQGQQQQQHGSTMGSSLPPTPQLAAYVESPLTQEASNQPRHRRSFSSRLRRWFRFRNPTSACRCSATGAVLEHGTNVCFTSPIICNDPRLLMATTWGTKSSPRVSTLYPDQLNEGLEAAVQDYVRTHVRVLVSSSSGTTIQDHALNRTSASSAGQVSSSFSPRGVVVVPALLAWHRHDFGAEPNHVLETILPYMSVEQLRQMDSIQTAAAVAEGTTATTPIPVVFDGHFDWTPGIPSSTKSPVDRQERPIYQQENVVARSNDTRPEMTTWTTHPAEVGDEASSTASSGDSKPSCFTSNVDEITAILESAPSTTTKMLTSQLSKFTMDDHLLLPQEETGPWIQDTVQPGAVDSSLETCVPPPSNLQRRQTSSSSSFLFHLFGRSTAPQASVGDDVAALPMRRSTATMTNAEKHNSGGDNKNKTQDRSFFRKALLEQQVLPRVEYDASKYHVDSSRTAHMADDSSLFSHNDVQSGVFPCDVSEITYGSEFRDAKTLTTKIAAPTSCVSHGIHGLWRPRYGKGGD